MKAESVLRVNEVHFNHDPAATGADALNIRLSDAQGTFIQAPEWRYGYLPRPAAYALMAVEKNLTIKARLSGGPRNGRLKVRAVDDSYNRQRREGCLRWFEAIVLELLGWPPLSALGNVMETIVRFDDNGDSGLVELNLPNHRIKQFGVGIYLVGWRWQIRRGGWRWRDFGTTNHKVYVVVDIPRPPWSQDCPSAEQDNPYLPWTEALDVACLWAKGAVTREAVARLITEGFNSSPLISYSSQSTFVTAWQSYLLSSFLNFLRLGASFAVNCSDSASAVATLSNLLGCDLYEGRIGPLHKGNDNFVETRSVLLIGGEPSETSDWQEREWGYHEVAWWRTVSKNEYVYDGCLRLDLNEDDQNPGRFPHLATKMKFEEEGLKRYSYYLLKSRVRLGRPFRRTLQ